MQLFTYAAANAPKAVNPLVHVLVLMACSATKMRRRAAFRSTGSTMDRSGRSSGSIEARLLGATSLSCQASTVSQAPIASRNPMRRNQPSEGGAIIARGLDDLLADWPGLVIGPTVRADIGRTSGEPFSQIIIAGAGDYRRSFHWLIEAMSADGLIAPGAAIEEVEGGIGEPCGQLGHWLRRTNEAPASPVEPLESSSGLPNRKGRGLRPISRF
jgi:hypothetical protein